MTTLIIARHGNTFTSDQTPTRVGARTDLPLVESGIEQAHKLGTYLKESNLLPTKIYTSTLKRTLQTAQNAQETMNTAITINPLPIFDEIDYGVDENQTEDVVVARLGQEAIDQWNKDGTVPNGWKFNPDTCIKNWKEFANTIKNRDDIVLVVTSNGVARFAPHITDDFEAFRKNHSLKLSTGAFGIIKFQNNQWVIEDWNIRP